MICIACADRRDKSGLCSTCRAGLLPCPVRRLPSGGLAWSAFRHEGPGRRLVHRLKYQGLERAGTVLGEGMVQVLPAGTQALIPVPRARSRRWRYGVDPADFLAAAISAATGLPVVRSLRPGWWWPQHAGRAAASRSEVSFRPCGEVPAGAVLVDDVITGGGTLAAAWVALGPPVLGALTATSAV